MTSLSEAKNPVMVSMDTAGSVFIFVAFFLYFSNQKQSLKRDFLFKLSFGIFKIMIKTCLFFYIDEIHKPWFVSKFTNSVINQIRH